VCVWMCRCVGYGCVFLGGWEMGVWLGVSLPEHIYMGNRMLQVSHIFILKIIKHIIGTKNMFNFQHVHSLLSSVHNTDYGLHHPKDLFHNYEVQIFILLYQIHLSSMCK
jgi:hypothetical protein